MPASKKLWNVAGFSKAFTDTDGLYRSVEHLESIKVPPADVPRLLNDGFVDKEPEELVTARKQAEEVMAAQKKGEDQVAKAAKEIAKSRKRAEKMRAAELQAEKEKEAAAAAATVAEAPVEEEG